MNKLIIAAAVGVIGVLFFTACHKDVNTPAGSPAAGTSSAPESVAAPKGDSPVGIWYEQNDSGDRLEITKDKIKYISGRNNFEDEMKYKSAKQGDKILIEPEDFFIYEDISYDRKQDMVIGYTMSHTDGDGGHHYLEFLRVPYIAPPPPVYPDAVDKSDPNAKKDFEDLTVRSMKLSFYDEGMPYDVNSSMAPEPPYKDHYSYDLKVLEDGTGLVSSSFCREIELTKEQVDELQKLVREADLGQINGIDIHTADVPYDAPEYEAEIELASGDIIRSSANWDNVPENWKELYFYMTDRDLGIIGGQKNIRYTYDVLTKLGMKFFPITYHRPNGSVIVGRIHWVDTFFYDEEKDIYAIRISPEIMPLLINLTQNFTTFDLGTAMRLRSKYTQKLYELCCKYGGDYRFSDGQVETTGNVYKKRVVPIAMEYFRVLFNLNEIRDKKTGRVLQESSYESYKDIRSNILQVAQNELYDLFMFHASNVWFPS